MSDQYGMQYPAAQWGTPEDDFKPPYTQDPPQMPPYPPYGQPTVAGNQGQAGASPMVQPVYVPYSVPTTVPEPGDSFALASMILGIIAAAVGFIPVIGICLAPAPAIIGIVLGALGLKSERRRGMAIAGIILSVVGLFAGTVIFWI
jgi:hypothetical protein